VPAAQDDRALIAATARGDRRAFSALVARHRAAAWRLIRALAPGEQAAEDALQETFLAVYRGAASYRGEAPPRAWILGMARRQAARSWRRRVGEPLDPVPLHELGEAAGWGRGDPEQLAAALEDRQRLRAALAALSPADQEILVLRDLEQLSTPEVAAVLEISPAAVKSRLHRARLRLLAELRGERPEGEGGDHG
jgi:RNA polymerase sigma-70 factor (ECF subfamily)